MVSISVIVTTYNRPDALALVLRGLMAQSVQPNEVLVADDGSTTATRTVIERCVAEARFSVRHVWHEDLGFRAAAIRNRAIVQAEHEYVILMDGDCVPARDFIQRHQQLAARGYLVAGQRLLLSERLTQHILQCHIDVGAWGGRDWLRQRYRHGINRLLPLLHVGNGAWRCWRPQAWRSVRTCNVGVWREDLLRVNGLDEAFQGWGYEDSDLAIRLLRAGVACKSGRYATGVFHLWHADNDRTQQGHNHALLMHTLQGTHILAQRGLDQYL